MKATIGLEQIGNAHSPEVSEVYRDSNGVLRHRRVSGRRDYSAANKRGTGGIRWWFVLEPDKLYCVREQTNWREFRTYYVAVRKGEAVRLGSGDVQAWLSELSA